MSRPAALLRFSATEEAPAAEVIPPRPVELRRAGKLTRVHLPGNWNGTRRRGTGAWHRRHRDDAVQLPRAGDVEVPVRRSAGTRQLDRTRRIEIATDARQIPSQCWD